jgi:hypothetical protein
MYIIFARIMYHLGSYNINIHLSLPRYDYTNYYFLRMETVIMRKLFRFDINTTEVTG